MKDDVFWKNLLEHLRNGDAAFLCLVAHNTIHSPGTRGAKMFVRDDGSIVGTIGGGGMEADVIARGVEALEDAHFSPHHETLVHRKTAENEEGKESGLICAGKQTHVYYVCRPERDLEVVEEIVRRVDDDEAGVVELDPSGLRLGADGGLDPERPPVRLVEGEDVGGVEGESEPAWRYEEQLVNWKRAAVIGGGHVGAAICRQLSILGYAVENFDIRSDIFDRRSGVWADDTHVVDDYAECGELVRYPSLTHAIVVTSDQPSDVRALLGLTELSFPYIGVMGSPAKLHKIREDLAAEGVSDTWFDDVHAPIGLDMTSNKPPEIAVSIAAELLRKRESLFPHSKAPKP